MSDGVSWSFHHVSISSGSNNGRNQRIPFLILSGDASNINNGEMLENLIAGWQSLFLWGYLEKKDSTH